MDAIELLARDDKWYLGSGEGVIFAPTFPVWLDAPGFWDEGTIYQYHLAPLFTVTLLDHDGRELPIARRSRRWTPAELTVEYDGPGGLAATEVRTVQPGGVFASEWVVRSPEPVRLHAVAWTAQETSTVDLATVDLATVAWNGALGLTRRVLDRREVPLAVRMELAALGDVASWSASLSERGALQPHWRFTPFGEQWKGDALPRRVRLDGIAPDGCLFGAVHVALPRPAREQAFAFVMRLSPEDDALRAGRESTPLGTRVVAARRAGALTPGSVGAVRSAPTQPLARASRRRWREHFAEAPTFVCSDPYLERYFWYRWYGLRLNAITPGIGNYRWPSTCEGIGFFHQPITYSAQCHVRELRWLQDPEQARGVLRTIFDHQRPDGSLNGRVYANHLEGTDFYHANWGDAFLALDVLRPGEEFVREMYPALSRHAEWLVRTRDADGTLSGAQTIDESPGVGRNVSIALDANGSPAVVSRVDTLILNQGIGDIYRMYAQSQRDRTDFNVASIPPDFNAPNKSPFDPVYMRALYQEGYKEELAGQAWQKVPPGFKE